MSKVGMVYLRPVPVVFFRVQGPYATSVTEAWVLLFDWLQTHRLRKSAGRGYGLLHDNPNIVGHDQCRYDACIEMTEDMSPAAIEQISTQRLSGGAYCRRRHVGPYDGIRNVIVGVRDGWVPSAGLSIDPRRPIVTIYLNDPACVAPSELKADICVPVATATDTGCSAA